MIADRRYKKKKKVIDLETKARMIGQSEGGIKSMIVQDPHIAYSIVSTLLQKKKPLCKVVKCF